MQPPAARAPPWHARQSQPPLVRIAIALRIACGMSKHSYCRHVLGYEGECGCTAWLDDERYRAFHEERADDSVDPLTRFRLGVFLLAGQPGRPDDPICRCYGCGYGAFAGGEVRPSPAQFRRAAVARAIPAQCGAIL